MNIKDRFIQIFIISILFLLIFFYYKTELSPYPYDNYDLAMSSFKKHDAELNESLVLTRVGIIEHYDAIASSLQGLYSTIDLLKANLYTTPNPTIAAQLQKLETSVIQKDTMVAEFKRLNPVLIEAIRAFSKTMSVIIDSETQADIVERFSIQDYKPEHYEFLNKLNTLFRDTLIYTNTSTNTLRDSLLTLVVTIKNDPLKINDLDFALKQADTILDYQPKLNNINESIFSLPILEVLDKLNGLYDKSYDDYSHRLQIYRYFLYFVSILLLIIVSFAFRRLRNTVQELVTQIRLKVLAQAELDKTNQELEQRVIDRTRDLAKKNEDLNIALEDLHEAQDQLIVQEKMASVGMLTTGIAHEIKNPLNFINNFSDISSSLASELKEGLTKEKVHLAEDVYQNLYEISDDLESNCNRIKDYGQRADNIVNNMLMHSKESSAQKEMTKLNTLLESAINLAVHGYKAQHPNFDIRLDKNFSSDIDQVLVSPAALSQVFVYILNNSFWALDEKKSTPGFVPLIKVTTKKENNFAVIRFFDNGIGVPEKNINKIFEPFFTTKPTGRGNTGLGLSICYDIVVKQHKGDLSVKSIEGESTEFSIKIPINPRQVMADEEEPDNQDDQK